MNEVLRSILSSGSIATEDGKNRSLESAISPAEGDFLQEMIRSARPQVSLEVGCAYGVSSLYICEALREVNGTKHIIMDPYQHSEFEGIGVANLKRAGYLDLIDFREVPSYQCLSRLTEEHVTIDFAFIGYRDGLMIALLAQRPLRLRTFSLMRLDRHLRQVGQEWRMIRRPGIETRTAIRNNGAGKGRPVFRVLPPGGTSEVHRNWPA
jgi:predicted O-methyltransferase YrrM